MQQIKDIVRHSLTDQLEQVEIWHRSEPGEEAAVTASGLERLASLILAEHRINYRLWHVEDRARLRNVDAAVIAACKQEIDGLNQQRNDLIEQIDASLIENMTPFLPRDASERYNTETAGSVLDRMSILSLKIYHMEEQTNRSDVDQAHIESCRDKLRVLREQHRDLGRSLLELLDEYADGTKRPKIYFQFKMYNDPSLNPQLYSPDNRSTEKPER